jgi:hypothetical protein
VKSAQETPPCAGTQYRLGGRAAARFRPHVHGLAASIRRDERRFGRLNRVRSADTREVMVDVSLVDRIEALFVGARA